MVYRSKQPTQIIKRRHRTITPWTNIMIINTELHSLIEQKTT